MDLGPVRELPALNSFYERPGDREPSLSVLQAFLDRQPEAGDLIVLVTHYVTIAGMTGVAVSSGEGVLLKLADGGQLTLVRRLSFGFLSATHTIPKDKSCKFPYTGVFFS